MPLVQLSEGFQSNPPLPTSKLGPSGADSGWVVLCTFEAPVGLSKKLSCEAGNFSYCLNSHRFYQSEVLKLYSRCWTPGLHGLSHSPFVPPGLSACKRGTTWSASCHLSWSSSHTLLCILSTRLPISAPPTGLDECFFFFFF